MARPSHKAATPTRTLVNAATRKVRCIPIAGIRKKPVATVPAMAPAVLSAYKAPIVDPVDLVDAERGMNPATAALSSGSVVPISVVGTARIANEQTSRATVSHSSDSGAARCTC